MQAGCMIEEAELGISAELGRLCGVLHASNHGRERRGIFSLGSDEFSLDDDCREKDWWAGRRVLAVTNSCRDAAGYLFWDFD